MAAVGGGVTAGGGEVAAAMTGGAMCMVIVTAELQVVRQRIPAPADMRVAAAVEVSGEPHN
jgi:hypothetical protein